MASIALEQATATARNWTDRWNLPPPPGPARDILEWAEDSITVTVTNRPGRLRLDPYQRAPLADFADPSIRRVTLMWCSQVGKTLVEALATVWVVDEDPSSMMFMHASEKGLKKFIREKLDPVLLTNADINAKIDKNNRGAIPIDGFSFGLGGYCTMTTAGATSGRHGTTARRVIGDETDDWETAGVVSGLVQRMMTYDDSTLMLASTPTVSGSSAIEVEFMDGSQSEWYVPCLHCGTLQVISKLNIREDRTGLKCQHCTGPNGEEVCWTEEERKRSIRMGQWVEHNPHPTHKSYHLSQLASLAVSAEKTLYETRNYTEQEFATQIDAWPYEGKEIAAPAAEEVTRATPEWAPYYTTVGVDVQGDRLEYYVYQFDRFLVHKHMAHCGVIDRTEGPECGEELRNKIAPWEPHRMAIDGSWQYDWVAKMVEATFPDLLIMKDPPVEIVRGYTGQSFDKPLRGGKGKGYQWIATDEAKRYIYNDIKSGLLTIAKNAPLKVPNQLTSEKLIRTEVGQRVDRKWVKLPSRRNEGLDCTVYAYAAVMAVKVAQAVSPDLVVS